MDNKVKLIEDIENLLKVFQLDSNDTFEMNKIKDSVPYFAPEILASKYTDVFCIIGRSKYKDQFDDNEEKKLAWNTAIENQKAIRN